MKSFPQRRGFGSYQPIKKHLLVVCLLKSIRTKSVVQKALVPIQKKASLTLTWERSLGPV